MNFTEIQALKGKFNGILSVHYDGFFHTLELGRTCIVINIIKRFKFKYTEEPETYMIYGSFSSMKYYRFQMKC